ncbi:UTR2 [[Candida] subhashii]|uniref:Crh-like protein n=1 Tax=[Candida] subhashii TaxID=561895 RepID=A0A8J5UNY4_9ASCO|nr:UTR2 [[Candida] subhashii]KAG7663677.1 UTR2 [[Candida] subhashii]
MKYNSWYFISILAFIFTQVLADDVITCNSTQPCPLDNPCCSQFGICGTGAYCLGGCDIRYSYNISACMPMPKMESFTHAFDSKAVVEEIEQQYEYLGNYSEADWVYSGWIDYHDNALLVQMPANSTGTVLSSTKYAWYGRIGATLKTSHDVGVVTAFITFSDVQDEIDYEFVGYDTKTPQTNFYAQGILNYTNARNSTVNDTFLYYHLYEMDWTEEKIDWIIDGNVVRTLNRADTWNETTKRYDYPQTPSRLQISLWPGGDPSNGLGTIEWAGGEISWDTPDIKNYGYYFAYIKEFHLEAYDPPSDAQFDGNSTNPSDYHAYIYKSISGNEQDVAFTNKKTWLGSSDAVGFNPQNENDPSPSAKSSSEVKTSTIIKTSGSSTITAVTTIAEAPTANAPAQNQAQAAQQTQGIGYEPSMGFRQNAANTASSAGEAAGVQGVLSGVVGAIGLGVISFLI